MTQNELLDELHSRMCQLGIKDDYQAVEDSILMERARNEIRRLQAELDRLKGSKPLEAWIDFRKP